MLFRYPGGKSKLSKIIIPILLKSECGYYCEPYAGAAHVGLRYLDLIDNCQEFWLNDADYGIYCIWKTIYSQPESLKFMIRYYTPRIDDFYQFKSDLLSPHSFSPAEVGFKKLVLHQISYSGLGEVAGGPIGGKSQKSAYDVSCRWNRATLLNRIDRIHYLFIKKARRCVFTWIDGIATLFGDFLFFIDPPYFEKGDDLYSKKFSRLDHQKLMIRLKKLRSKWLLSYDNNDTIRKMYDWAKIQEVDVTYTIKNARKKKEILICV